MIFLKNLADFMIIDAAVRNYKFTVCRWDYPVTHGWDLGETL